MLSTFVGKNCGSGWREDGLAELVLDEVSKMWKRSGGGVIVEDKGDQNLLKTILQGLESNMSGGKVVSGKNASHGSNAGGKVPLLRHDSTISATSGSGGNNNQAGHGVVTHETIEGEAEEVQSIETRKWIKVIGAYEQPRFIYNVGKKQLERSNITPSFFPPPSHKITMFRDRYNLVYQRLLRNESFQTPSVVSSSRPSLQRTASSMATAQQSYSLTPIANLLGRHGTFHLLLGLLAKAPAGGLCISDLTGTINLDLNHAQPVPANGAWFAPGMIVLVHGIYEEDDNPAGIALGGYTGVGGTVGGRFVAASIGGPPSERRETTLGMNSNQEGGDLGATGGFGWVDFLGVGSERALGPRMRKVEKKCLKAEAGIKQPAAARRTIAIISDLHLDRLKTPEALRKIFGVYGSLAVDQLPLAFIMIGNFVHLPAMYRGGSGGSIEYKEYFDSLALVLSEFPALLRNSTFIFVPGDNDPWVSAFSAGASGTVPMDPVPDIFTSRIKRAFDEANDTKSEAPDTKRVAGEAIWTSNPTRLSIFGPAQEIVVYRDDMYGRIWHSAVPFQTDDKETGKDAGKHVWKDAGKDNGEHSERDAEKDAEKDVEEDVGKDAGSTSPDGVDPDDQNMDQAQEDNDKMDVDESAKDAESRMPETKEKSKSSGPPPYRTLLARKLVKTILDQGTLSPFPVSSRPVLWDYASSLNIYPLPTTLILADADMAPFALTYEGCHVVNPGSLLPDRTRDITRWAELDLLTKRGKLREERF